MGDDLLPPDIDDVERRKEHVHRVHGTSDGGARTDISVRDFHVVTDEPAHRHGTDTAPTPLETVIAALIGCKSATINAVAHAMRFDVRATEFDGASVIDLRGPRGVRGVRPYFESVRLQIDLYTDEPHRRVALLVRNVEHRCPVANLLRAADVDLEVTWRTLAAADAPTADT